MEKSLCAALYEMELDRFSYRHPYHKIVFVKRGNGEEIRKLKLPQNFQFEELQRVSVDLNFKGRSEKDAVRNFSSSRSKNFEGFKVKKVVKSKFDGSFVAKSGFVDNMKVRGASASLLRRNMRLQSPVKYKQNSTQNTIQIRIKRIRINRGKMNCNINSTF